MVKVNLEGVAKVRAKLADGTRRTYYYAWRGGPRLPGEPGSAEFMEALQAARGQKPKHHAGTLTSLLIDYQESPRFTDLAEATRRDYIRHIRAIETEFGDMPIAALSDSRVRGDFLNWRDQRAQTSRRQADYAITVLSLILAWAEDRGHAPANPLKRPGRTYRANRADSIWTYDDEAAFQAAASPQLALAQILAAETGQRQGDLLRLTWAAYDGTSIRLKQSKRGRRVVVPCTTRLRTVLDAAKAKRGNAVTILTTSRGTAWTSSGFRASWAKVKCDLAGLTFHDLRGTAVTRLAEAGSSTPEIATITGHSLKEVDAILDTHYLSRNRTLAESAIAKLDRHRAEAEKKAKK
ncbi:site-specific integrase [Rhodobacter sp. NTK016B]|uniref:site-specific integrase n=1 Tax=Rhodobacter sp. NTK016B TaxID=2759676 RepID=UPI0032E41881